VTTQLRKLKVIRLQICGKYIDVLPQLTVKLFGRHDLIHTIINSHI